MRRIPRLALTPLAVALAFVVLTAAVTVGVRVPPLGLLAPFPGLDSLDYSAGRFDGFSPLAPRFIEDVLGEVIPEPLTATPADPSVLADGSSRSTPDLERIVDDHPPTNDDFSQARTISGVPFTARTDSSRATRDSGDPDDCGSLGGTVWYRYSPKRNIGLIANTFGSDHPTTLGVFTGSDDLRAESCDTDAQGNAIVPFAAKGGRTYFFQIAAPAIGGDLVFNLEQRGRTTLESASPSGESGNRGSESPSLSGDGRYLAFATAATNLAPGVDGRPCALRDPGPGLAFIVRTVQVLDEPCSQIVVRDRLTGQMTVASVSSAGVQGHGHSLPRPSISADGRSVAFISIADNLVADDTNDSIDVFVHDLATRRTERVSVSSSGQQLEDLDGEAGAESPSISEDGRYVIFESAASNLVPGDTNGGPDVFVRDRIAGTTTRISVSSSGQQSEPVGSTLDNVDRAPRGSLQSASPCISPDGRYVAFRSSASNLVPGDTNGLADTFVHDRSTHRTVRISVSSSGEQANAAAPVNVRSGVCISSDGRYVAFESDASNLVRGDTNSVGDAFVHDRLSRVTTRVSVSSSGEQTNNGGGSPTMSANGRYVAFHSSTPGPGLLTAYLHDLLTRTTTRIAVTATGEPTEGDSGYPDLSRDARVIAYDSTPPGANFLNVYTYERPKTR